MIDLTTRRETAEMLTSRPQGGVLTSEGLKGPSVLKSWRPEGASVLKCAVCRRNRFLLQTAVRALK
jgi:hypothetical protein